MATRQEIIILLHSPFFLSSPSSAALGHSATQTPIRTSAARGRPKRLLVPWCLNMLPPCCLAALPSACTHRSVPPVSGLHLLRQRQLHPFTHSFYYHYITSTFTLLLSLALPSSPPLSSPSLCRPVMTLAIRELRTPVPLPITLDRTL